MLLTMTMAITHRSDWHLIKEMVSRDAIIMGILFIISLASSSSKLLAKLMFFLKLFM